MSTKVDFVLKWLRSASDNDASWPVDPSEAVALIEEIERLRELLDAKSHEAGLYARRMEQAQRSRDEARAEERAAVVAWLRRYDANVYPSWLPEADAIERGEHRREGG